MDINELKYDVFVSYKSENANQARAVADFLTSRGLRVWFAEYEIRSDIYESDVAIQAAVDRGIAHSSFFLLFTNDRWSKSYYCQMEFEKIPKQSIRTSAIEVFVPQECGPREKFPDLKQVGDEIHWDDASPLFDKCSGRCRSASKNVS